MNRDVIAKRIGEARERCGMSQQVLVSNGLVRHASLVAIENGNQDVKTWELLYLRAF